MVSVAWLVAASGFAAPLQAADDAGSQPGTLIINGAPIPIGDAPWQVALLDKGLQNNLAAQFCGGSIVSAEWIVTAAHCVEDMAPTGLQVLAGVDELSTPAAAPRRDVAVIVIHPQYSTSYDSDNDIAMVKLADPLELNGTTMSPIAMPDSIPDGWPAADTPAFISGWGNMSTTGYDFPTTLHGATVDVLTNPSDPYCGGYSVQDYDPVTMMCAGTTDAPVKDTCQGDSGGPLAVDRSGTWTLAGITSWGSGCADPDYPGVYTRVTQYTAWIAEWLASGRASVSGAVTSANGTVSGGSVWFYASCQDWVDDDEAGSASFSGSDPYEVTVLPGQYRVYIEPVSGTGALRSWHAAKSSCADADVVTVTAGDNDLPLLATPTPTPTPTTQAPVAPPTGAPTTATPTPSSSTAAPPPVTPVRQSMKPPVKRAKKGKRVAVAKRTRQGQPVKWKSRTKKVCSVSKGKVRTKKKGRCRLVASAPGSSTLLAYRATFTIRIR